MNKIEKTAKLYLKRSMSKKAWKRLWSNDRGDCMPRPVVFEDKRFKHKYVE